MNVQRSEYLRMGRVIAVIVATLLAAAFAERARRVGASSC